MRRPRESSAGGSGAAGAAAGVTGQGRAPRQRCFRLGGAPRGQSQSATRCCPTGCTPAAHAHVHCTRTVDEGRESPRAPREGAPTAGGRKRSHRCKGEVFLRSRARSRRSTSPPSLGCMAGGHPDPAAPPGEGRAGPRRRQRCSRGGPGARRRGVRLGYGCGAMRAPRAAPRRIDRPASGTLAPRAKRRARVISAICREVR